MNHAIANRLDAITASYDRKAAKLATTFERRATGQPAASEPAAILAATY